MSAHARSTVRADHPSPHPGSWLLPLLACPLSSHVQCRWRRWKRHQLQILQNCECLRVMEAAVGPRRGRLPRLPPLVACSMRGACQLWLADVCSCPRSVRLRICPRARPACIPLSRRWSAVSKVGLHRRSPCASRPAVEAFVGVSASFVCSAGVMLQCKAVRVTLPCR